MIGRVYMKLPLQFWDGGERTILLNIGFGMPGGIPI
jgi:hypothetical protein